MAMASSLRGGKATARHGCESTKVLPACIPIIHDDSSVAHHELIGHARVVKLYRDEFKSVQGGEIGITLNGDWKTEWDDSPENIAAAQVAKDFAIGWFADPVYLNGDYPTSMRNILGDRLPTFTEEERALVLGSSDFYGMNTYTTHLIRTLQTIKHNIILTNN
jgi:beta-glucosidase/6-phospho-beta-glucosidase/beta-galactosidase